MAEINMFRNAPDQRALTAGETLFVQGDLGDEMYAVIDGEIELSVAGRVVDRVGAGKIVGEMALIDSSPRSATATAAGEARVVPVDRKKFVYLVQEHPTFALLVMEIMAERLRRSNVGHA
jgi:CRP/FNR family transcriptional regulator, cyclic AMP receptor protein